MDPTALYNHCTVVQGGFVEEYVTDQGAADLCINDLRLRPVFTQSARTAKHDQGTRIGGRHLRDGVADLLDDLCGLAGDTVCTPLLEERADLLGNTADLTHDLTQLVMEQDEKNDEEDRKNALGKRRPERKARDITNTEQKGQEKSTKDHFSGASVHQV